jgi:hypothetical protein
MSVAIVTGDETLGEYDNGHLSLVIEESADLSCCLVLRLLRAPPRSLSIVFKTERYKYDNWQCALLGMRGSIRKCEICNFMSQLIPLSYRDRRQHPHSDMLLAAVISEVEELSVKNFRADGAIVYEALKKTTKLKKLSFVESCFDMPSLVKALVANKSITKLSLEDYHADEALLEPLRALLN